MFLLFCFTCKMWIPIVSCWLKPRHRLGIVVAIAFVYRVVSAGAQRQTNTQTQTRVLQGLAIIQQLTSIRDQFKALWLPSPLPFSKLHLQVEYPVSRAVEKYSLFGRTKSLTRLHSAESLSVCLINQLNFFPACATDSLISSQIFAVLSSKWPVQLYSTVHSLCQHDAASWLPSCK